MTKEKGPPQQYIYTEEGKSYGSIEEGKSYGSIEEGKSYGSIEEGKYIVKRSDTECECCTKQRAYCECRNLCSNYKCKFSTCYCGPSADQWISPENGIDCCASSTSLCNLLCWTNKDNYCAIDITFPLCCIPCCRCSCKS